MNIAARRDESRRLTQPRPLDRFTQHPCHVLPPCASNSCVLLGLTLSHVAPSGAYAFIANTLTIGDVFRLLCAGIPGVLLFPEPHILEVNLHNGFKFIPSAGGGELLPENILGVTSVPLLRVPIVIFTDYPCTWCRLLAAVSFTK